MTPALVQKIDPKPLDATTIEQALIGGDLAKLTPTERVNYYNAVCQSLNLNPLTKPFAYIALNGKLVLYALKDCTEQLRSTRLVSVKIVARELADDCYVVTAQAALPSGRQDESIGAVSINGLKGEARANAMMKAETKAKRRVTLSICGLGMLDETEVESVPAPVVTAAVVLPTKPEGFDDWLEDLTLTADQGTAALQAVWANSPKELRAYLRDTARDTWTALKAQAAAVIGIGGAA